MKRWVAAAVVSLVGLTGCAGSGGGEASCVGPQLTPYLQDGPHWRALTKPLAVVAGQRLTVYGYWWADGCRDTNAGPEPHGVPPFHLLLVDARQRTTELGTMSPGDADKKFGFTVDVTIPSDTPRGSATLTTDSDFSDFPGAQMKLDVTS